MKHYDHYSEAARLADLLDSEGLCHFADDIRNAILEGATGTEIFMGLRWQIGKVIDAHCSSPATEALARRLYAELDKSLK